MSTPITDVPWMIEGGAKHTVQVARNLAFMAAGGTEGIILGKHLEVRELDVPGPQVQIYPGTCAVQNRAAGAADEMYVVRVPTLQTLDIAPTDASGGRSDLIVVRVENPWASGETWPDPADPTVGPYASLAVISDVAPGANSVSDLGLSADDTAVALARIDIPASTGTITQAMIVDCRVMSAAVSKRELAVFTPTGSDRLDETTFVDWGGIATNFDVPSWATHARVQVVMAGIAYGQSGSATNVTGDFRIRVNSSTYAHESTTTRYNCDNAGGVSRVALMCAAPAIPLSRDHDRGFPGIPFALQGRKNSGSTVLTMDEKSTVTLDVEFINAPESNV